MANPHVMSTRERMKTVVLLSRDISSSKQHCQKRLTTEQGYGSILKFKDIHKILHTVSFLQAFDGKDAVNKVNSIEVKILQL